MNKLQEIAPAYREASDMEKQQIELKFSTLMKLKINYTQKEKVDTLGQLIDDISRKAIARGLTPEILEEILAYD